MGSGRLSYSGKQVLICLVWCPDARKMDMNDHSPFKSHDEKFSHLGFIKVDTILYQNESMYYI